MSAAQFWKVVAQVELMDLAFAVDSVLVAVAISDELWVIYTGVFLGILALRMLASFVVSSWTATPGSSTWPTWWWASPGRSSPWPGGTSSPRRSSTAPSSPWG